MKQRVVHGGSEVFHVHHVHGGSIRWRRQPGVEPGFDRGLDKRPPLLPQATERTDSQAIGPSETYDVEHECGSGGCQQGAGDYMWCTATWRTTTWQGCGRSGGSTTRSRTWLSLDGLPPLAELPDRAGQMHTAVTSQELAGRTVDWKGQAFQITRENLGACDGSYRPGSS